MTAATPTIAQSCAAPVELLERPARAVGLAHPYLGDHLVGRERRLEEALEEVGCSDRALTGGPACHDRAAEREHHRRQVRRGVAVGQRTGERAAVANLRVADFTGRSREERDVLGEDLAVLDVVVAGEPTDRDVVAGVVDVREVAEAAHVDEHRRGGEAELHERQQRVPAGEDLGVVAVLGEQRDRFVDGVGACVGELGRDHERLPALMASAPAITDLTMLW